MVYAEYELQGNIDKICSGRYIEMVEIRRNSEEGSDKPGKLCMIHCTRSQSQGRLCRHEWGGYVVYYYLLLHPGD